MAKRAKYTNVTVAIEETLLQRAQAAAQEMEVDLSELVESAIHASLHHWSRQREELLAPINPDDPNSMSQHQVSLLIKQMRREEEQSQAA